MFKRYSGSSTPEETNAPAPQQPVSQPQAAPAAAPQPAATPAQAPAQPQYQQTSGTVSITAAPASTATGASSVGKRNVLSNDVEIKGNIKFENDLLVDGKIDGEINSNGTLTIGEQARIKAEIKTRSVVVYGKVHGNITVTDRVELKSSAEVIGDIKGAVLSIEAGAVFVGKSMVGAPSSVPAAENKAAPAGNANSEKKSETAPAVAK